MRCSIASHASVLAPTLVQLCSPYRCAVLTAPPRASTSVTESHRCRV
jgi:hypothetical protein